jgi:hypothetical protein
VDRGQRPRATPTLLTTHFLRVSCRVPAGRCQAPAVDQAPQYAVLRCIAFTPRPGGTQRQLTNDVEIFSVDSTDESNVALFHPHPHACAVRAAAEARR